MLYESDQDVVDDAMERARAYNLYMAIGIAAAAIGIIVCAACASAKSMAGIIGCILAAVICVFFARKLSKEGQRSVTICSETSLETKEDFFVVKQVSGDTYEGADIYYREVNLIREKHEPGMPGFYVSIAKSAKRSQVRINGNPAPGYPVFYISGAGYDLDTFRDLYEEIVLRCRDAKLEGVTERQPDWDDDGAEGKEKKLFIPWIALLALGIVLVVSAFI